MKSFKISSPAYKANGFHGTYYSIAICSDNGDFQKLFGDHAQGIISGFFFNPEYKNINEIIGIPFSDADRFIKVEEVNINSQLLAEWAESYTSNRVNYDQWNSKRTELFGNDVYNFLFNKKGKLIPENNVKYRDWVLSNPSPVSVPYYGFLNSIIKNEN